MIKTVTDISQIDVAGDIRRDINKSLTDDNLQKVEEKALDKMDEVKNRQTRQGKSPAQGGRWDNRYSPEYARREKGGRRSPVTLRNNTRSIDRTRTVDTSKGTELQFQNRRKAVIFGYHDEGINYRRKGFTRRQIYPDSDNQVPDDVDAIVDNEIFRLLNR